MRPVLISAPLSGEALTPPQQTSGVGALFDLDTTVRYVYHSNRLDGVTLTEDQTRDALEEQDVLSGSAPLEGADGRRFEAEVVLGHARAMRVMSAIAQSSRPVSEVSIQELHRELMGDLLLSAGEYRECSLRYKGLLIASPPENLARGMGWLVRLVDRGFESCSDPHRFSWRVHHEFITLHPFIEGNGRMARLLLNLARLRLGLELTIVPFESRDQYSRAIIDFQKHKIDKAKARAQRAS